MSIKLLDNKIILIKDVTLKPLNRLNSKDIKIVKNNLILNRIFKYGLEHEGIDSFTILKRKNRYFLRDNSYFMLFELNWVEQCNILKVGIL